MDGNGYLVPMQPDGDFVAVKPQTTSIRLNTVP